MKTSPTILLSPAILTALAILLLNDLLLKQAYPGWLTGKLSDFAGMFAFPVFLSVLLPVRKSTSYLLAAGLFVFWKLPYSDAAIDFLNEFGVPLARRTDLSDLIALFMLPVAWYYQKKERPFAAVPPAWAISLFAVAFCATSMPPQTKARYVNINKTYEFEFSKKVLAGKLNRLTLKYLKQFPGEALDFRSEGDLFFSKWNSDTLGIFIDANHLEEGDTIHFKPRLAEFVISGNDQTSTLTFLTAYRYVPAYSDKDYREKTIRQFEKSVIRKLRRP